MPKAVLSAEEAAAAERRAAALEHERNSWYFLAVAWSVFIFCVFVGLVVLISNTDTTITVTTAVRGGLGDAFSLGERQIGNLGEAVDDAYAFAGLGYATNVSTIAAVGLQNYLVGGVRLGQSRFVAGSCAEPAGRLLSAAYPAGGAAAAARCINGDLSAAAYGLAQSPASFLVNPLVLNAFQPRAPISQTLGGSVPTAASSRYAATQGGAGAGAMSFPFYTVLPYDTHLQSRLDDIFYGGDWIDRQSAVVDIGMLLLNPNTNAWTAVASTYVFSQGGRILANLDAITVYTESILGWGSAAGTEGSSAYAHGGAVAGLSGTIIAILVVSFASIAWRVFSAAWACVRPAQPAGNTPGCFTDGTCLGSALLSAGGPRDARAITLLMAAMAAGRAAPPLSAARRQYVMRFFLSPHMLCLLAIDIVCASLLAASAAVLSQLTRDMVALNNTVQTGAWTTGNAATFETTTLDAHSRMATMLATYQKGGNIAIATLVLLALKAIAAFSFGRRLGLFARALSHTATDLAAAGLLVVLVMGVFGTVGRILYGSSIPEWSSVLNAAFTLVTAVNGQSPVDQMTAVQPDATLYFYYGYWLIVQSTLFLIFFSILGEGYSAARMKVREEEEEALAEEEEEDSEDGSEDGDKGKSADSDSGGDSIDSRDGSDSGGDKEHGSPSRRRHDDAPPLCASCRAAIVDKEAVPASHPHTRVQAHLLPAAAALPAAQPRSAVQLGTANAAVPMLVRGAPVNGAAAASAARINVGVQAQARRSDALHDLFDGLVHLPGAIAASMPWRAAESPLRAAAATAAPPVATAARPPARAAGSKPAAAAAPTSVAIQTATHPPQSLLGAPAAPAAVSSIAVVLPQAAPVAATTAPLAGLSQADPAASQVPVSQAAHGAADGVGVVHIHVQSAGSGSDSTAGPDAMVVGPSSGASIELAPVVAASQSESGSVASY